MSTERDGVSPSSHWQQVSDTARWVATYRAWESSRPDALFRDPYAERLAGERGEAAAQSLKSGATGNGWPVIVRTKLIDDLVMSLVARGSRCIVNLAAGFDVRPYRLDLPTDLRWVEADVPVILEEKERLLSGERARCTIERVPIDLSVPAERRALFDRISAEETRVTVITEGLLIYLEEMAVAALARDLSKRPCFVDWIVDFSSPAILKLLKRGKASSPGAWFQFAPADGVSFFEALGWQGREVHSLFHEAARHRRVPLLLRVFAWFPPPDARRPGNKQWSFVVRLVRGAGQERLESR